MSPHDVKAVIGRWLEVWNTGNVQQVDELVTHDYVRHDPNSPDIHGPEAEKQLVTMYLNAFPDLQFKIEDMIVEGNRVAVRVSGTGTHKGDLAGIPATNKHIQLQAMEIYHLDGSKISEQWVLVDMMGMLQQLGVIPAPGETANV